MEERHDGAIELGEVAQGDGVDTLVGRDGKGPCEGRVCVWCVGCGVGGGIIIITIIIITITIIIIIVIITTNKRARWSYGRGHWGDVRKGALLVLPDHASRVGRLGEEGRREVQGKLLELLNM